MLSNGDVIVIEYNFCLFRNYGDCSCCVRIFEVVFLDFIYRMVMVYCKGCSLWMGIFLCRRFICFLDLFKNVFYVDL